MTDYLQDEECPCCLTHSCPRFRRWAVEQRLELKDRIRRFLGVLDEPNDAPEDDR